MHFLTTTVCMPNGAGFVTVTMAALSALELLEENSGVRGGLKKKRVKGDTFFNFCH